MRETTGTRAFQGDQLRVPRVLLSEQIRSLLPGPVWKQGARVTAGVKPEIEFHSEPQSQFKWAAKSLPPAGLIGLMAGPAPWGSRYRAPSWVSQLGTFHVPLAVDAAFASCCQYGPLALKAAACPRLSPGRVVRIHAQASNGKTRFSRCD